MLIDSHVHLASPRLEGDLEEVLDRARERGVSGFVAPATDLEDAERVLAIADAHPDVWAAVGIHPCDVHSLRGHPDWLDQLRSMTSHSKVVAIGEVGLDYFHAPADGSTEEAWRALQAEVLTAQLELAVESKLNVILHNRESWADLVSLVLPFSDRLRGQFHCFTGTPEEARQVIEQGHLVSFTGIVTFKKPGHMADTATAVPGDAYLVETDAPYLAPMPNRGKRCEPGYVADTAGRIAELRGQTLAQVEEETTATALQFFPGMRV